MGHFYTTGGYVCGVCGEYVTNGTIHTCGGSQEYGSGYYTSVVGDTNQNSETIRKLNEIIELLKKINNKIF